LEGGRKVLSAEGLVLSAKIRKQPRLALTYEVVIKLSEKVMEKLRKRPEKNQNDRKQAESFWKQCGTDIYFLIKKM
jgi:hypothetical protein